MASRWVRLTPWLLGLGLAACSGGGDSDGGGGGGAGGGLGGSGGGGAGGGGGGGGQECTNTCEIEGGTECQVPGFRTCTRDADGCLAWSPVEACGAGNACVEGQCANCTNECEPGSVRCGESGGLEECVTAGDGDPCYEWGVESACPEGESCSAGQCRPAGECVNECGSVGEERCAGDAVQACEDGPDGCRRWGAASACADGETCSLGKCRGGQCVDECQANSRRCSDNGFETCGNFDGDECLEWSARVPCEGAEVCSNGECAETCSDECGPGGARQCAGNAVQTCGNHDGDACLEWGANQACADDQACSNGQCRAACVNECEQGSRQCSGNGVESCGNFDDDECLEWSVAVPCDDNESCSNGACAVACQNECDVQNARRCGQGGVQTCGNHDADVCLEWSVGQACGGGQVCANGECAARCVDECAPGSAQCAANGVQRCGNFDEDDCLEWSAGTPCAAGEACSNGRCTLGCEDECRLGAERCAPGGQQRCGNTDGDACAEWGAVTPCPQGESCSNGACAAQCVDECSSGARRCTANGVETCGNFDGDACAEWSQSAPCPQGQVCSNGQCAPTCSDECAQGTVQCAGNGFEVCGNFDGDNCLEWSAITACQDGTSCSGGVCSRFCRDECVEDATRCGNGGVETCGNFDNDDCKEWGAGVPCADGQVCANGACAARCADECAADARECDGNGVRSCGNFDADNCREWSQSSPCAAGQVCAMGECRQPAAEGCDADNDCLQGQICNFGRCIAPRACEPVLFPCPGGEECRDGVCRPQAESVVGRACQNDDQCGGQGFACLEPERGGYCVAGCDVDFPCPSGSTCYQFDDGEGGTVNLCLSDCASANDCRDDQACYASGSPLGGACYLAQCEGDADCQTDPVIEARCEAGACVQTNACDLQTGEGCPMGSQCYEQNGVGVCLQLCDAFAANTCGAGKHCIPTGNGAEGNCIPAGAGALDAPCAVQADCGAGLRCIDDGVGNSRCLDICDTQRAGDCAAGNECVATIGDGRAGVCIAPCQSECNANTARCTDRGVESCGQFDEDLCLEWSAAQACQNGQTCNELADACTDACRADADCAHPLVPATCQQGRCVITSQCAPGGGAPMCVAPDQCFAATNDGAKGVCQEPCDLLGPACSQAADHCTLFGAGNFCLPPGNAQAYEPCAFYNDCARGNACLPVSDVEALCFPICDVQNPACAGGSECFDLEVDGRLGACLPPG